MANTICVDTATHRVISVCGVDVFKRGITPYAAICRFSQRFKIDEESGCWIWTGAARGIGYGAFHYRNKQTSAHRFSYELFHGPISNDHIHHVCENKACVNPAHLQDLTRRDHILVTPTSPLSEKAGKTHCMRGHPLSGENLYVSPDNHRHCRICTTNSQNEWKRKNKEPIPERTHCKRGHPWVPENWCVFRDRKQCKACHQIHMAEFKRRAGKGVAPRLRGDHKTHCVHGHELTDANKYIDRLGYASCRTCRREWWTNPDRKKIVSDARKDRAIRRRERSGELDGLNIVST